MSISTSLRRAARLQEKIEALRAQLAGVLDKARAELASAPKEEVSNIAHRSRPKMLKSVGKKKSGKYPATVLAPAKSRRKSTKIDGRTKAARAARPAAGRLVKLKKRSPLAGIKRSASPSGPLAPAVVKVLASRDEPMNVRGILDGLLAGGYKFNASEPKKNLAARIYRLKGVRQVSTGLFATT